MFNGYLLLAQEINLIAGIDLGDASSSELMFFSWFNYGWKAPAENQILCYKKKKKKEKGSKILCMFGPWLTLIWIIWKFIQVLKTEENKNPTSLSKSRNL